MITLKRLEGGDTMFYRVDVKYEATEPVPKNQTTMDLKSKDTAGTKSKDSKKKATVANVPSAPKKNIVLESAFDAVRERIGDATDFIQFNVKKVQT